MLLKLLLHLLAFGSAIALPAPEYNYVVHERRQSLHPRWEQSRNFARDNNIEIPIRIGLTQQNLHLGDDFLLEVSHPTSALFGHHWTPEEVAAAFAPSEDSVSAVTSWLVDAGVSLKDISHSKDGGWLHFNTTLEAAERLLQAQYHVYTDTFTGERRVSCNSYSVPESVSTHIDFITPTIQLTATHERRRSLKKGHFHGLEPKFGGYVDIHDNRLHDLAHCDNFTTPHCIRALYELPKGTTANPKNSYGIVELSPNIYAEIDLNLFFANFSPPLVGRPPKFASIDGGPLLGPGPPPIDEPIIEALLDLSYAMALVYPVNVTLYQVGDLGEGGSIDFFLDAIDASYCTFEGGDDPIIDGGYPDLNPGGFNQTRVCGEFKPPNVVSLSYEGDESGFPQLYMSRMCSEYMKLGLQGVTVIFSSGDSGVGGNSGCLDPALNGTTFNPEFPSSCPYVTSVGGTQIIPGSSVYAPETALNSGPVTGGGFSNFFGLPSYQEKAVLTWFNKHPTGYGPQVFNKTRKSRGIPDVSAIGKNYIVAVAKSEPYIPANTYELIGGTSASAPTFGSVITLLNEARLNIGKSPVGFINPVLYANPWVMNDITTGSNPGCGTPGFNATTGWDPVTGLGTPNYPKLLELYLSLP